MDRRTQVKLARLIATVIAAVVSALIGHKHLAPNKDFGPPPGDVAGPGRPIDGDSLYVGSNEVRLKGIDAPEGRQNCTKAGAEWACGNAARDTLQRLIGGATVTCRVSERDKHGRLLAHCSAQNRDLNAGMVEAGMAVAYGGFAAEEASARSAKRGMWAGEFERPREWRDARGIGH